MGKQPVRAARAGVPHAGPAGRRKRRASLEEDQGSVPVAGAGERRRPGQEVRFCGDGGRHEVSYFVELLLVVGALLRTWIGCSLVLS